MHLTLFFTYSISLKTWAETGLIDREILLYKKLIEKGIQVSFITYGDERDYSYREKLGEIEIIPFYGYTKRPKLKIVRFLHSFFLPFILKEKIKEADILKTNQMWGSWVVMLSKLLYKKKTVVRCGFEKYRSALDNKKESVFYKILLYLISWMAYKFCDAIIVTSKEDKEFIIKTFSISEPKVNIFMNYIDTNLFKKTDCQKYEKKLLFIGRLNEEKNIFSLLDAISQTDYELDIIGDGDLRPKIEAYIKKHNIKANLLGRFPNAQLPEIINRYPVFVLPSYYEGNPKVLLEAMACECAVVGTSVRGIREIIKNNENGLLCETDADSIKQAITTLMQDKHLRDKLSRNAREFIIENLSLYKTVEKELSLYKSLMNKDA